MLDVTNIKDLLMTNPLTSTQSCLGRPCQFCSPGSFRNYNFIGTDGETGIQVFIKNHIKIV